jgi:SAM-dependent methyltransferase
MTTQAVPGLAEAKQRTRATWAAGDFAEVARLYLWAVGDRLVRHVGVGRNEDVLDVACGTGNAALRAAQAGGRTIALDLTPELFDAGRVLAAEAHVEIDWVEGDAEALPFDDESFDVVLSTFGVMFAPRHQVTADELVRVLKPGGRFGLANWAPDSAQGDFFRLMGEYAPPPPPFMEPPLLWGNEDHVRGLFAGTDVTLEFSRESVPLSPFESGEKTFDFGAENFGPMVMMRPMLEQQRKWSELRARAIELYESGGEAEYLVVVGRKLT